MNDLLISRYASGLVEFRSKEQIEVLELRGGISPKATSVKTRVRLDSGGYALVDYVFRMTDDAETQRALTGPVAFEGARGLAAQICLANSRFEVFDLDGFLQILDRSQLPARHGRLY